MDKGRLRSLFLGFTAAALLGLAPLRDARAADAPYEINVILALTGSATFIGAANRTSLEVLEEVVNRAGGIRGRPVHFVFYDDQTNPQTAVQLASEILAKHVPVLLGPNLSASCRAVSSLIRDSAVEYCVSPALYPERGSYVFASSVSSQDEIVPMVRYFRDRGWRRIATLTTTDATGQDADAGFSKALALTEYKDVTLVANEHFNPNDVSVAAQLARIKAAAPQVIVMWASGTPFGTALRGLKDAGMDDIPIGTTGANTVHSQLNQYTSLLPANLYFVGPGFLAGMGANAQGLRAVRTFLGAMKQHNVPVDNQTGIAWDPGMIVVDALRALGTDATPTQIRDWIEHQRSYGGISGAYDFLDGTHHGLTAKDVMVTRWDNAKQALIGVSGFDGAPLR
jgi:branched-chain amino acid transport system substrate-binding protein